MAEAILDKEVPHPVGQFARVWEKADFIARTDDISFDVIWPQKKLKAYVNWSQTINGNSVTFAMKYGEFEMLFTGDQNDKSEKALLKHIKDTGNMDAIACDVLKAPHHGSGHNLEEFIKSEESAAVITVASLGSTGFGQSWKHPSTDVIKWAGGAHRFYSTYTHERRFKWDEMRDAEKREAMQELTHVLIETDGKMFRVVEVDAEEGDPNQPPTVSQVKRANGTRWIKASK